VCERESEQLELLVSADVQPQPVLPGPASLRDLGVVLIDPVLFGASA
jgi:hypothetical protein